VMNVCVMNVCVMNVCVMNVCVMNVCVMNAFVRWKAGVCVGQSLRVCGAECVGVSMCGERGVRCVRGRDSVRWF